MNLNLDAQVVIDVQQDRINALTSENILLGSQIKMLEKRLAELTPENPPEENTPVEVEAQVAPKAKSNGRTGV